MSKEYLEALKELKRIDNNITYLLSDCNINEEVSMNFNSIRDNKSCEVIEQALTELQAIKESNPSKALEFVDGLLKRYEGKTDYNIYITKEWLLEIKQALIKAQEQEKENDEYKRVLEIIKEKDVDVGLLKRSENWLDYYTRFKHKTGKNTELTEEEFDLLKRWINK